MSRRGDISNTWAELRATRADPPPATRSNSARRATYVSALEQSEQLFRAAAEVTPATAPLLIYYGLSQAGRAIMAAAASVRDDWRLVGHGINRGDLTLPLPSISVFAEGSKGSFVRLSKLLGSPIWGKDSPAELNALWDVLPEALEWPLRRDQNRRAAHHLEYLTYPREHSLLGMTISHLPTWLVSVPTPGDALRTYLKAYPTLGDFTYIRTDADPLSSPDFRVYLVGDYCEIDINVEVKGGAIVPETARRALLERIATRYGDGPRDHFLVPAVGSNTAPMHPLMTWWAVLYTLSMLARYEPAAWAGCIDVDKATHAVAIEQLLGSALAAVPDLIASTIRQVR